MARPPTLSRINPASEGAQGHKGRQKSISVGLTGSLDLSMSASMYSSKAERFGPTRFINCYQECSHIKAPPRHLLCPITPNSSAHRDHLPSLSSLVRPP